MQAPQVGLEPTTLRLTVGDKGPSTDALRSADYASERHAPPHNANQSPGQSPGRIVGIALAALLLMACESERTIPTRTMPKGESYRCVGVQGSPKAPGIEYELSTRNTVLAIVFSEMIAPPVMVLHHETFCPAAATSTAPRRR